MFGPIGNLVAYPGPRPGTATIQKRKRRSGKSHDNPACKNFKFADLLYHNFSECHKQLWRSAQRNPKKSGYDLWMTHAPAHLSAGLLVPDLPPTPGGYRAGIIPPGSHYWPVRDPKPILHQTCFGPVAWDWEVRGCQYYTINLNLDLRHPEDLDPFDVTLSAWLLWNSDSSSWMHTIYEQPVSSNAAIEVSGGPVPNMSWLVSIGVIQITYANLRQKFVIRPAQILHLPLSLCTADTPCLAISATDSAAYAPHNPTAWKPPGMFASFLSAAHDTSDPRLGNYRSQDTHAALRDLKGRSVNLATFHLTKDDHTVPGFGPAERDCWWYQLRLDHRRTHQAGSRIQTGRTIFAYDSAAISFKWTDNRRRSFKLSDPPTTPENP